MWKNWIACALLVGMQNVADTLEHNSAVSWKTKHAAAIQSRSCTFGHLSQINKFSCSHTHTKIWTQMFIRALFIKAPSWKGLRCPLVSKWLNKLGYINIMEYYLAMKEEWIIDTHNTWRNLPRITLSEKANLKILYTVWFHFYNRFEMSKHVSVLQSMIYLSETHSLLDFQWNGIFVWHPTK